MTNKNKKILTGTTFTFTLAITIGVLAYSLNEKSDIQPVKSDSYSLVLDEGLDLTNNIASVSNGRGSSFDFLLTSYTKGNEKLGSLALGGQLLNKDAFHSIQNVSITLSSGSLDFYLGWKQYETSDIEYSSSSYQEISTTGTSIVNLSTVGSSYFKLVAKSNTVIDKLVISYSCANSSTTDVRLRVAAPTVGGSESISNSNYIWICTNIENSGTWSNYAMNKDTDGSWYYDFNDVTIASSGYTYTLVVTNSNTEIAWDYQADETNVGFGIGEGQREFNIDGVNFSNQPSVISTTYTLNLTINTSGAPSNFGNIQFVYNYTNSTSNYQWNNIISTSWQSSYTYSFEGILDTAQTCYFRLYMWSDSKDLYVGNGNTNFVIEPTGNDIDATVTFTYSTSSPITGTCVVDSGSSSTSISHDNVATTVYGTTTISPVFDSDPETFTASYSGNNIRIDDNSTIVGLVAGTTTKVTLTSYSGLQCTFNVTVASSTYSANFDSNWCGTSAAISTTEGWFTSTKVNEITGMGQDFYNGIDVSSFKALVDNGSKFYNKNGIEQHLLYILKDAGVNWIRLKLWVDPQSTNGISYGGGESNLANTLWMAKEVKAAGLKFLLDFHYSDYWTHPSQQILPKAWNSCNSVSALCAQIKSYTTTALNAFKNANCLPDMVQLGNEISSGIYLQKYTGSTETLDAYGQPSYLTGKTSYAYGTNDHASYYNYIKAASEGVDAVDSNIKKVLHWAKGGTISAGTINSFFSKMPSDYYDYAAISFYPYYCFGTLSAAQTILNGLNLSKPWFIAETSYPFSGGGYVYSGQDYTAFTISNWTKYEDDSTKKAGETVMTHINESYTFNSEGQANLIHDLTASVVSAGGLGIFYWESAWIPNLNVGWAGQGSLNTWGNQGFFSFDGKAIANLDLFKQMSPHI